MHPRHQSTQHRAPTKHPFQPSTHPLTNLNFNSSKTHSPISSSIQSIKHIERPPTQNPFTHPLTHPPIHPPTNLANPITQPNQPNQSTKPLSFRRTRNGIIL